jgi:hypothetical protein
MSVSTSELAARFRNDLIGDDMTEIDSIGEAAAQGWTGVDRSASECGLLPLIAHV